MKVLMQSRKNFFSLPGGDTVQLTKTKAELEKLGIEVDISLDFAPDLTGYDIVHLSNVTRIQETYIQLQNAKKYNKPVVLSTIFWPMDEFEKIGQKGIRKLLGSVLSINNEERLKAVIRYLKDSESRNEATKNLWRIGYKQMQDYVVKNVDYYLPNSDMEMTEFSNYFGVDKKNYTVVYNAIDKNIALDALNHDDEEDFDKYSDAVICVGRIETRKNQLELVKALDGSPYKLVLVGKPSSNQPGYYREIKKYIDKNPNFYHIENIDYKRIYSLYKRSRVSVLPSWLDTPGLVSLEAGAMGCNLVVSVKGSPIEYFKDYAEYCTPGDLESIRNAVDRAFDKPRNPELQSLILDRYTWESAAKSTLEGYKIVLAKGNNK